MKIYYSIDLLLTEVAGLHRYAKEMYNFIKKENEIIPISFYYDLTDNNILKKLKKVIGDLNEFSAERYYFKTKLFGIRIPYYRINQCFCNINDNNSKKRTFKSILARETFRILSQLERHFINYFCKFGIDEYSILFSPYHAIPNNYHSKNHLTAQMVHDIIPLRIDHSYYNKHKKVFKSLVKSAIKSDLILTNSEFTKNDLIDYEVKVGEEKFCITYLGNSLNKKTLSSSEITDTKIKYGIPKDKKYILTIYSIEPRKNNNVLIDAWKKIINDCPDLDIHLVAIGSTKNKSDTYHKVIHDKDLSDSITFTGFIEEDDLPAIYAGSMFSIYPSLYEGFGLPVIESMNSGRFCLASSTTSIPEVVGENLPLINPNSVEDIYEQILKIIKNPNLLEEYNKIGYENSLKFTWLNTGKETIKAFRNALKIKFDLDQ